MRSLALLTSAATAFAQQVYIPSNGTSSNPQCAANGTYATATPVFSFQQFSFSQTETSRTATSIPAPTATTTFAAPYAQLSHLVPNLITTQWGNWDPSATVSAKDTGSPYGNASWTALWMRLPLVNFTRGIYSTTVQPTAVPTSELILPPPEYLVPEDCCYYFPHDFMLGVSSSAIQIEGAIADEGRSPASGDFTNALSSTVSPDFVANENYYLYKQDIERIASMGVKYYSMSVPWSRILPFVLEGTPINKQALDHYDDLVNFILEKGMLPTITLIHTDTPMLFYSNITDAAKPPGGIGYTDGGFQRSYMNQSFEDAFVHYGKILMTHFADRVPVWFTFNEPLLGAVNGKSIDAVLKSHARLAHFYREEIKGTGKISMKLNDNFGVPLDPNNSTHVDAANHFNSFQIATFGNPLFLGLDYPDSYKMTVTDYVPLTAEDLQYINGTADFLAIDPYTATVISPPNNTIASCASNSSDPLWPYCVSQSEITATGWNIGYRSYSYVYITPKYFRTFLNYLWNTFKSPILVTEFGFPVYGEAQRELTDQLFDSPRAQYYQSFLNEALKAIWEDGVKLLGTFAWSFADNWEFGDFDAHFGIQTVNRTTQERRYKKSFFDFVDFIESRRQKA